MQGSLTSSHAFSKNKDCLKREKKDERERINRQHSGKEREWRNEKFNYLYENRRILKFYIIKSTERQFNSTRKLILRGNKILLGNNSKNSK